MRILHICQRDDPDTGGSLRVAEALVREQRAVDVDSWLLFLYGPPSHISEGFGNGVICLELRSSCQAMIGVFALIRAIRRIKPDIIHSHDGIVWPRLALMNLRVPVVMHSHLPALNPGNLIDWLRWVLIRRTTDILIGISMPTIRSWEGAGFARSLIRYVPNGVDLHRFHFVGEAEKNVLRERLGLPVDKKILLWVGRLHQAMKGSDRVEHLAGVLPEDTMLVVVGNGPEYTGMLERCADLLESKRLVMVGSVCYPEEYYKASDAYLFSSYYEPFGLVILEAAACGLPIMAFPLTQGGGAIDLLREFGAVEVCDGVSSEQACAAMNTLKEQMGDRKKLREQAQNHYSWDVLNSRVGDIYDSLLGQCRGSGSIVLHICQRDDLATGGATRIAFDLVMGQRRCGIDSHLLFLYGKPGALGDQLPYECTHYLGLGSASEVLLRGWRLYLEIDRIRPDVVHHHDMLSWPQIMHLLKRTYCIAYHVHLDYHPPTTVKSRIAWSIICRSADVLISPSHYGKECLVASEIPEQRISVVPNGTETPDPLNFCDRNALREKYALKPDQILLGWAGRLHCATKKTDDFIGLFRYLPGNYVGIIAGTGPDEAMLKRLVTEQGLGDRIIFHGFVQDMSAFYQNLDGFVLTSRFESFGLVVIEALVNCVPVFLFSLEGGINDLLQLPGVYVCVSPRSLNALSKVIQQGFADADKLSKLVDEGGLVVRQRYSIVRMATETLGIYSRLCEK